MIQLLMKCDSVPRRRLLLMGLDYVSRHKKVHLQQSSRQQLRRPQHSKDSPDLEHLEMVRFEEVVE